MNNTAVTKQQQFFDVEENQYSIDLIQNPPFHTGLEIQAVLESLKLSINMNSILDFGAGSGRLTIPMLQAGYSVLAIDISSESLENLKTLAKKLNLKNLRTGNSIPKNQQFGMIVGADILHHINIDEYLPILYNALEKHGKLFFSEPGGLNPVWYIYLPLFKNWEIEKGIVNCSFFTLKNKFKRNGFKEIKITGLGFFPRALFNWSGKMCKFNDWLGTLPLLKTLAYRYIIEADKGD